MAFQEREMKVELYKQQIKEYNAYIPPLNKQPDFDSFWEEALAFSNRTPLEEEVQKIDYPIKEVEVYQVRYKGVDGTSVHSHYLLPGKGKEPFPCLILFHGYGGNKGSVSQFMKWLIQGYAVLAVDCRGQGETGDSSHYSSGSLGTWATQGLLNREEYYYFKVYTDSKRAVDFVMNRPEIDKQNIGVMGASLGGGIALAVGALDQRPKLIVADVPNMCNIELSIQQKFEGSLVAIENYLARYPERMDQVLRTLSYFDNLNLAPRIKSRVRVSVAFKDLICPPKPIFGVYNHICAQKSLEVFPFSGHDAPGSIHHTDKTIDFVNRHLLKIL